MKSSLKQAIENKPQLGMFCFYPAPGIIERIGTDWDWILIDGQHGEMDYADILAAVRACDLIGRHSVVRAPGHEAGAVGKILDTGADGVMAPMVDSAEQAALLVQAAKFPPMGRRSFGGRRPIDLYGRGYAQGDRPQPLLICQIETRTALEHVREIAATPGVDAVLFGPDDAALCDGLNMDQPRPEGYFDDALKRVAEAAQKNGIIAGGVFVNPSDLRKALAWGYRLIAATADAALLAAGSKAQSQQLRECMPVFYPGQ